MVDASVGWSWARRRVARTADGLSSLVDVTPAGISGEQQVMAVAAVDALHAWVVAGNLSAAGSVTVEATRDGGANWIQAHVPGQASNADVTFLDPQHGWLTLSRLISQGTMLDETLMRTLDGGRTWSQIFHGARRVTIQPHVQVGDCLWSGVRFVTPLLGFTGLSCEGDGPPQVEMSRDGGLTWGRQALPRLLRQAGIQMWSGAESPRFVSLENGITFVSNCVGDGLSCTFYGALYRTDDGGRTWSMGSVVRGAGAILLDMTHSWVPYGCAGACPTGPGSTLLTTDNGGVQWTASALPSEVGPNMHASRNFVLVTPTVGFVLATQASGSQTRFFRTTDGGRTFSAFVPSFR
jgi:photosystem II stability/assembly factor-like uncharacterized protein